MNYIPVFIVASTIVKAPFKITAEEKGGIAIIKLTGTIYEWGKASGSSIDEIIEGFVDKGITEAKVYINCPGGSVFEADEIKNLLDDNFETITVQVGALAASAATIFVASYPTTAKANSMFMIHKPMLYAGGNVDEIESSLKMLRDKTNEYRKMYATKMGITEDAVDELWDKGDFWMTAKEAKKKGLIDAIAKDKASITKETQSLMVACGSPVTPEITKQKPKNENRMELSVLAVSLGLSATATEAEVNAKIASLQAQAKAGVDMKAIADQKKIDDDKKAIKAMLDQAELDKKITPELRATYQTLAEANFDSAKTVIEALTGIEAPASGGLKKVPVDVTAERKSWTYANWREKDAKGFEALSDADQQTLLDAHYKED